jgi:hypothetical protein
MLPAPVALRARFAGGYDTKKPVSLKGTPNRDRSGPRLDPHEIQGRGGTGDERATKSPAQRTSPCETDGGNKPGDGISLGVCISGVKNLW